MITCEHCGKEFSSSKSLEQHHSSKHPSLELKVPAIAVREEVKRFKERRRRSHSRTRGNLGFGRIALIGLIAVAAVAIGYLVVTQQSTSPSPSAESFWIGKQAPTFTLPVVNGSTFSLINYEVKGDVLLYFHEGLTCSPCLQQAIDLNKDYQSFRALNITMVAISTDSQASLAQRAQLNGINHVLVLSDQNLSVDKLYSTLGGNVSMMAGTRAGHTFVLVNPSGTIKWRADYGPGTMYVQDSDLASSVTKALA